MSRQAKERKVCSMPKNLRFQPSAGPSGQISLREDAPGPLQQQSPGEEAFLDDTNTITMTVEEYETIRLIDYMNFNQEECAHHMQVARTTVQRIYNQARKKLAIFLVDGPRLYISGGSYELCDRHGSCNGLCEHIPSAGEK